MGIKAFSLPVVGAPYSNKDGTNRQFEISMLDPGERLELLPEPKNPHDEHAIAVLSPSGVQIGYITSERAPYVGTLLRAGHELTPVFQAPTQWGAMIRIGVNEVPSLPVSASVAPRQPVEDDFYPPDPIWPDD